MARKERIGILHLHFGEVLDDASAAQAKAGGLEEKKRTGIYFC